MADRVDVDAARRQSDKACAWLEQTSNASVSNSRELCVAAIAVCAELRALAIAIDYALLRTSKAV